MAVESKVLYDNAAQPQPAKRLRRSATWIVTIRVILGPCGKDAKYQIFNMHRNTLSKNNDSSFAETLLPGVFDTY